VEVFLQSSIQPGHNQRHVIVLFVAGHERIGSDDDVLHDLVRGQFAALLHTSNQLIF
jgi:hypothetical protein